MDRLFTLCRRSDPTRRCAAVEAWTLHSGGSSGNRLCDIEWPVRVCVCSLWNDDDDDEEEDEEEEEEDEEDEEDEEGEEDEDEEDEEDEDEDEDEEDEEDEDEEDEEDEDDEDEDGDDDEDEDEEEEDEDEDEDEEHQVKEVYPDFFCSFQACAHPLANVGFCELRYWQLLTGVKLTQQQLVTRQALVHVGGQAASAIHTPQKKGLLWFDPCV